MSILFFMSYIFLIISFLCIKKTNNKLNLLLWIFISVILYMGYNCMIVYLLSFFKIKSSLILRSFFNIVISFIINFVCKSKQKYYIDKMDIVMIVILLYLSFVIFMVRFGFDFCINFRVNDAAVHYAMAKAFMANNIYNHSMHNILYKIPSRGMFFSSINVGTFMEVLKPLTGNFYLYKSFIIFEVLSFFISGVLFYFIVKKNNTFDKKYILTVLLVILYELGYPLLNLLYGFHYWGLVILVISTIILTIKELESNKLYKNKLILFILFIQTFSVFVTYYLYVPVVYGALGLYFIFLYKWKKKISFRECIIYIIFILVIPFIFGLFHFGLIEEYILNFGSKNSMSLNGANYKNLLGNFIFLFPLLFYVIENEFKSRRVSFVTIITCLNVIYMIVLFVLCMSKILSSYYYNKIYNLLWLVSFIYLVSTVYHYKEKFVKIYIYSYIIISILACFRIEMIIKRYNYGISANTVISNIGNVYDTNIEMLQKRSVLIDKYNIELLRYVKDHSQEYKNSRDEIPFIADYFKKIWVTQLLDIIVSNNYQKEIKKLSEDTYLNNNIDEVTTDETVQYFVWIPDRTNIKNIDKKNFIVIYKCNGGYVLRKK